VLISDTALKCGVRSAESPSWEVRRGKMKENVFARRGAWRGVTRDKHVFTEGFEFWKRDKGVTKRDKSAECGVRKGSLLGKFIFGWDSLGWVGIGWDRLG
jgi:hypothetical protein